MDITRFRMALSGEEIEKKEKEIFRDIFNLSQKALTTREDIKVSWEIKNNILKKDLFLNEYI